MKRTMSYYGQRDSYGEYDDYQSSSRRNSNSFSEEQNSAKRKKQWRNRRRGSGVRTPGRNSNDAPVFKEPIAPVRRSPTPLLRSPADQYSRGGSRDNPFRSGTPNRQMPQSYFDINGMPDFIEPHHSGKPWYWDNYFQDCKNWQDKHKLAYYRSRCLALEFENQMLFEQIHTLIEENCVFAAEHGKMPSMKLPEIPGRTARQVPSTSAQTPPKKQGKGNRKTVTSTDSEFEFEVPEDMMAIMEQSMRHKLNLSNKRTKDEETSKTGEELKKKDDSKKEGPKQPMGQKRKEELDLLYGQKSALVQGLETAYQLSFNRNIDTLKPDLWMAVPLNPLSMA